jgi:hypothetical protein
MLEFNSTNNNDCGCDSGPLNGFTDPSCPAPSVVTWNSIQGKPSCFTPCPHTHTPQQIINLNSYINSVIFANSLTTTNSIQLTAPSGVLNANLKLSANTGTGYKVPLSILSDGLIGQIPYATGSNAGILSAANWVNFNNKFNTPNGTTSQYVRGDGSLASFPVITSGTVTSVGLSMPAAFTVSNSPVTGSGVLTVTGAGTAAQYIRGNGTLATFPTIPTLPSFLAGSVPFGNGTGLIENNTKFFWDNTLFKLKLTDSKLEFLNTGTLGSALLEYKSLVSVATSTIDQSLSSVDNWLKIRAYNNTSGLGKQAGLLFGTIDGTDTTAGQVGIYWKTPNTFGGGNRLVVSNEYDSSGIIEVKATAYTQIDGLAVKKAITYTFSNVNVQAIITYPNNVLRFNYGGTTGLNNVSLPYNPSIPIPDGYIVFIKALNTHGGAAQNVSVTVQAGSGQSIEGFTFTKTKQAVIFRYDGTENTWDLLAVYNQ